MFETLAEYERTAKLPHDDPYLNGMEFLKSAAENLNQCDEKLKLDTTAVAVTTQNSHLQAGSSSTGHATTWAVVSAQ